MEYDAYLNALDKALHKLRAQSLGQMTPLQNVIPCGVSSASPATARQVAQILVLQVCQFHPMRNAEIHSLFQWLSVVCRFIMTCPEEDHTFFSILKISRLAPEVRQILLADAGPIPAPPNALTSLLEEAIWRLTEPVICIPMAQP